MEKKYILALDQGTTSSRAIVFDKKANIVAIEAIEFEQIYPKPGWVEHRPDDILDSQIKAMKIAIKKAGISAEELAAVGITNQRETAVIWNKKTGKPVYNAIVWQCRRTSDYCDYLKQQGYGDVIRRKTGLVIDAYFSGTKLRWFIKNVPEAKKLMNNNELAFGTVDSWLMYNLTKEKAHVTEPTNASRTMLYNIYEHKWDNELLKEFDIDTSVLPEVKPSNAVFGTLKKEILGAEVPVAGCAGDQQAALFGQLCYEKGLGKNTYGTGCFMLMNTGKTPVESHKGLLTTVGYQIDKDIYYALEGSIFIAGAVVQWLRDGLDFIKSAADIEKLARSVEDNGDVYFVPAFVGLGTPYWDQYARGTIIGITRGTKRGHIARAALESMCYQTRDVATVMTEESGIELKCLMVDGGATVNDFLMQTQANILDVEVKRPKMIETTALGASYLAGLGVGFYSDLEELRANYSLDRTFKPEISSMEREKHYNKWRKAVERSKNWTSD
ncbi:MAG: glycerol kinase GlpK [Spirochaetota bacterium]